MSWEYDDRHPNEASDAAEEAEEEAQEAAEAACFEVDGGSDEGEVPEQEP